MAKEKKHQHGCKACGACQCCELCDHCGCCRNCGKAIAKPFYWIPVQTTPYYYWPPVYVAPYVQQPYVNPAPNYSGTWQGNTVTISSIGALNSNSGITFTSGGMGSNIVS